MQTAERIEVEGHVGVLAAERAESADSPLRHGVAAELRVDLNGQLV